jgi:hypothetical protein
MMRKITIAPIIGCVLSAAVPSSTSAPDIVKMLQDQGYTVQFNGTVPGPLSNCSVDGVHGLTIMMTPDGNLMMKMDSANHGTVFVDVSCTTNN